MARVARITSSATDIELPLSRLNLYQIAGDGAHGVGQRAAHRGEAGDRGQRDQEADQGVLDGATALLVVQETAEEERHRLLREHRPGCPAGTNDIDTNDPFNMSIVSRASSPIDPVLQ